MSQQEISLLGNSVVSWESDSFFFSSGPRATSDLQHSLIDSYTTVCRVVRRPIPKIIDREARRYCMHTDRYCLRQDRLDFVPSVVPAPSPSIAIIQSLALHSLARAARCTATCISKSSSGSHLRPRLCVQCPHKYLPLVFRSLL